MSSSKPRIGVILLNWNGLTDTLECLQSIEKSKTQRLSLSVYVADNASQKDELAVITQKYPNVIGLQNDANLGYSGGNNVAIQKALDDGCEYICLLNNDTTVDSELFQNLYEGLVSNNFDLASPKIYFYKGDEYHKSQYKKSELGTVIWYAGGRNDWNNIIPSHRGVDEVDHGQFDRDGETDFATGCCMLIKRDVIEKIGLLDDSYIAYFEDNDFCMRARNAGFTIGYCGQPFMWHKNAGSSGGSGSKKQSDLVSASRFKFAMKYGSLRAKLAILRNRIKSR